MDKINKQRKQRKPKEYKPLHFTIHNENYLTQPLLTALYENINNANITTRDFMNYYKDVGFNDMDAYKKATNIIQALKNNRNITLSTLEDILIVLNKDIIFVDSASQPF